jgi:hypothetical protein
MELNSAQKNRNPSLSFSGAMAARIAPWVGATIPDSSLVGWATRRILQGFQPCSRWKGTEEIESGGLPPFRDKTAEGWGTHFSGGERVGHPPFTVS